VAAYEARDRGVPEIHLRAILDAAEKLEKLIGWPSADDKESATSAEGVFLADSLLPRMQLPSESDARRLDCRGDPAA